MAFNHYAKIKRILENQPEGWIIKRINEPTTAKNFKGETVDFHHYYRIYSAKGEPIKYCKFQQIERLAKVLGVPAEELPIVEDYTSVEDLQYFIASIDIIFNIMYNYFNLRVFFGMIRTVKSFEANGLIDSAELSVARCSQAAGTQRHTIGYELEVLPSAAKEAPEFVKAGVEAYEKIEEWLTGISEYGVELEGEYELQSPPATHPLPLIIATRGLVRSGWLPESPQGVVTSHISIGTTKEVNDDETRRGLTSLLRAVDLAGGTTPGRLMAPINKAEKNQESLVYSWAQGGLAGVYLDRIGAKNRIEFRTPRYRSLGQFAATLNNLYFLSRGFLADANTDGGRIYGRFEEWFDSYRSVVGLPGEDFDLEEIDNPANLREYIEPYAEYLRRSLSKHNGSNIVKTKVFQTVAELASDYGLCAVT